MAIIECPECKLKISSTAVSCPRCGYHRKKNKSLIAIIILLICIVLLLGGLFVTSLLSTVDAATDKDIAMNDNSEAETDKNSQVSDSVDPYGLVRENNILGKDISVILDGYVEGVDYVCKKTNNGYEYTFDKDIYYPVGEDATITIYTDATTYKINMVAYTFYVPNNTSLFTVRNVFTKVISDITNYYDIDPKYSIYADDDFYDITKEQFNQSLHNDDKVYYDIFWFTDYIDIIFEIPNLYQDKRIDCTLGFILADE